jgi:DNA mismatch repair protein MutH
MIAEDKKNFPTKSWSQNKFVSVGSAVKAKLLFDQAKGACKTFHLGENFENFAAAKNFPTSHTGQQLEKTFLCLCPIIGKQTKANP